MSMPRQSEAFERAAQAEDDAQQALSKGRPWSAIFNSGMVLCYACSTGTSSSCAGGNRGGPPRVQGVACAKKQLIPSECLSVGAERHGFLLPGFAREAFPAFCEAQSYAAGSLRLLREHESCQAARHMLATTSTFVESQESFLTSFYPACQ